MNSTKPIKTAIVGFGSVAEKMHAPLIDVCPDLDLVEVVERHSNLCEQQYPGVKTFRSFEELLSEGSSELIVITTPNEFHFPMAKLALESGKHVVVDKPITIHSWQAEELQKLASEKGLICTAFQNRRFDGDFRTVQEILQNGSLGEVHYIESHFDRFRPQPRDNWREKEVPGNGITYDLGTHLIDQICVLWGAPESITATIRKQRPQVVADDYFDIQLDYGNRLARVTAGVLVNAPTPKFLVLGEKGTYQKFGLDVQEEAFKEGRKPIGENWGLEEADKWGKVYLEEKINPYPTLRGDYRFFYNNIAKAILLGEPLLVRLEEAIVVLKLIESAFLSSEQRKTIARSEGGW